MSLTPIRLTSKTAVEMIADARALIPQLTPRWTDLNDADQGIAILRTVFWLMEMRGFELDMRAAETTLTYVRQRPNAVRLLRLIGYRFQRRVAARTTLRFSLPSLQARPVPLYPYWDPLATTVQTRSNPPIPFVLDALYTIPAGSPYVLVPAIQGTRATLGPVSIAPLASRVVTLPDADIAEGTVLVKVNDGFWKVVTNWVESGAESPHVLEETSEEGVVTLTFGDGTTGMIPSGSLEVLYVRTLGDRGNLAGRDRITSLVLPVRDADGTAIVPPVTVTNTESATGGEEEETLLHAKKQAPREYAAQRRAVTKTDLAAYAEGYPGVRQAAVIDVQDLGPESGLIDYFQVKIPIVPAGGAVLPTAALKRGLQNYLERLKPVPDNIEVLDPVFVPVLVSVDLYVKKTFDQLAVKAAVQEAIQSFFTIAESPSAALALTGEVEGMTFGQSILYSALMAAIQDVSGVAFVETLTPADDLPIDPLSIAVLSSGSPVVNILGVV